MQSQSNPDEDSEPELPEDVETELDRLQQQIAELGCQQESLRQLSEDALNLVSNRDDCSITITNDGEIDVKLFIAQPGKDLDAFLRDYDWCRQFVVGYDTRQQKHTYKLGTTLENFSELV